MATTDFLLTTLDGLTPCHVSPSIAGHEGREALRLELTPEAVTPDGPNFALIDGVSFRDGTISLEIAGRPLPGAFAGARGFVGVAFRVEPDLSRFECIYLRPTNGRADVQLRRNRATQYFSYPDFKFDRLREEAPGEYESYVDLIPGAWTQMRIEVSGDRARLFVHDAEQPSLIVNDLKHGPSLSGGIGLYIDHGTEGFFRDLHISTPDG